MTINYNYKFQIETERESYLGFSKKKEASLNSFTKFRECCKQVPSIGNFTTAVVMYGTLAACPLTLDHSNANQQLVAIEIPLFITTSCEICSIISI